MDIFWNMILITVLLAAPLLAGCLFGKQSLSRTYLRGVLLLWGGFEIMGIVAFIKGWNFTSLSRASAPVLIGIVGAGVIMMLGMALREKKGIRKNRDKKEKKEFLIEMLLILPAFCLVGSVFFLYSPKLESWYLVPETVTTILDTNSIHGYNPLTGQPLETPKGFGTGLLNLPVFYACLIEWFQVKQETLLFYIIPVWILFISFLVFYQFAILFFGNWKKGHVAFLWIYSFILFFGDKAYMNESYQMLHYAYEGRAILTGILLPYCFYLLSTFLIKGGELRAAKGFLKLFAEYVLVLFSGVFVMGVDYGFGMLFVVTLLSVFAGLIGKAASSGNSRGVRKVRKE